MPHASSAWVDSQSHRSAWQSAARLGLRSGAAASVLSAAVLAIAGVREEGSAAGPLNGPSQWVWGRRAARTTRATLKHTLVGYAIHHLSAMLWATLHERTFPRRESQRHAVRASAQAIGTTAAAYIVDYHLTPRRFRPGFRKHLSPSSIFWAYGAFAAGLALARLIPGRSQRS